MTQRQIDKELAALNVRTAELLRQRDKLRSKSVIRCHWCGKGTGVRFLTYIQTYWYEHPYSCTGGDNWHPGEGQYDCPKCGKRCRDYFNDKIKEYKRYFGNHITEHKR